MKKILVLLAALLISSAGIADDRPIAYSKIPQSARTFITKHFSNTKVLSSLIDSELFESTEYTVYLDGGIKLEFNGRGMWKDVECPMTGVPASIVPANIDNFIKANYVGAHITKINLDRTDYEVKLSSGMELKFTLNGDFMGAEMGD